MGGRVAVEVAVCSGVTMVVGARVGLGVKVGGISTATCVTK